MYAYAMSVPCWASWVFAVSMYCLPRLVVSGVVLRCAVQTRC
jgi:hypothetical protein